MDQVERERLPQAGRVVIVANHPLGAVDSLALLAFVGSVRRDVRILANDLPAGTGTFETVPEQLEILRLVQ